MANYTIKSIDQDKYGDYQAFGYVRSKREVTDETGAKPRSKAEQMYVKRRNGFSYNSHLRELEDKYENLSKKKRHKGAAVIVGIIFFILMIAFLAVAGVELYYGISKGVDATKYPGTYYFYNNDGQKVESNSVVLEKEAWTIGAEKGVLELNKGKVELYKVSGEGENAEKTLIASGTTKDGVLTITTNAKEPVTSKFFTDDCKLEKKVSNIAAESATEEEAEAGALGQIKEILDKVHNDYLSKVTGIFDGKTNEETGEYTDGIADKVAGLIPGAAGAFLSADTIVGVIALILFIVCLIIFCECSAKTGKKYEKRQQQIKSILADARNTVRRMKEEDISLMNKGERKMYMWETVISNGIRKANGGDDDDDD